MVDELRRLGHPEVQAEHADVDGDHLEAVGTRHQDARVIVDRLDDPDRSVDPGQHLGDAEVDTARTGEPSARELRRAKIAAHVRAVFGVGRGTYGVRRVQAMLTRSDDPQVATALLRIVRDIMQENGLRACQPRAYKCRGGPRSTSV